MTTKFRPYKHPEDYRPIDNFLIRHHQPNNQDGNWVQPAWEYMHNHPSLDSSSLEKIGIWEDKGDIVAVVHYESQLGEAFFQFHPSYRHLREKMFAYAEGYLWSHNEKDGRKHLCAFINDTDKEFACLVKARGYEKKPEWNRPVARYTILNPFPPITLPEGFRLTSLAEERNWAKVHRILWRGFNHEGEPPAGEEELESRRKMFDTPQARWNLKVAAAAPDGNFVAFCGTFYEPTNCYAYVEPVATDPEYRQMGLGTATVLESIRRCGELGATVAYVGSDQEFYLSLGFEVIYNSECWEKNL